MQVFHGVRPSQPPRPRVMHEVLLVRAAVKRSQGRPWAGYRAAKRVQFRGADLVLVKEGNTTHAQWLAWVDLAQSETPMHVAKFFARNLGGLIRVRQGMPDRLMKAKAER